ncbi:MAG TPA: alpha/beta-type small acid-soluble spore protein [Limnochordia bacterium]|nr:alpha/beta-type small acid-soluble spore protein [Limnochordia bacterium]
MAQGANINKPKTNPQVYQALNQFKYEVASELGINPEYKTGYWGNITSRECGAVGGHMVRRLIALAEQQLFNGPSFPSPPQGTGGFRNQ